MEILEGRDYMGELQRRVLVERLKSGIERAVEDLGFSEDNTLEDIFTFGQHHKTDDSDVTMID